MFKLQDEDQQFPFSTKRDIILATILAKLADRAIDQGDMKKANKLVRSACKLAGIIFPDEIIILT